jgi:hypothetical protein
MSGLKPGPISEATATAKLRSKNNRKSITKGGACE